jgi:hypothetical protein
VRHVRIGPGDWWAAVWRDKEAAGERCRIGARGDVGENLWRFVRDPDIAQPAD